MLSAVPACSQSVCARDVFIHQEMHRGYYRGIQASIRITAAANNRNERSPAGNEPVVER